MAFRYAASWTLQSKQHTQVERRRCTSAAPLGSSSNGFTEFHKVTDCRWDTNSPEMEIIIRFFLFYFIMRQIVGFDLVKAHDTFTAPSFTVRTEIHKTSNWSTLLISPNEAKLIFKDSGPIKVNFGIQSYNQVAVTARRRPSVVDAHSIMSTV